MTASALQRITPDGEHAWLHGTAGARALESALQSTMPAHALMQRAGEAAARLAIALAPHARLVHFFCGPGNNGGDGLVAARWLHQSGRKVLVTRVGSEAGLPTDAGLALMQAREAGVAIHGAGNATPANTDIDLTVDALLGIGLSRAPEGDMAEAIHGINAAASPVLALDLPSGLNADTGDAGLAVRADHTLTLLTLKPGLFTGRGRDLAGQVWLADLGAASTQDHALALLTPAHRHRQAWPTRLHASHKGQFGDLAVVGGERGMTGAAWLAASAALHAGAGRVYVSLLDEEADAMLPSQPELMGRSAWWTSPADVLARATAVCGCGGGQAVHAAMPSLLSRVPRLVLDADALNAVAQDSVLQALLRSRADRGHTTVLTPHPLEAARLLGVGATEVQRDRLHSATRLAQSYTCVVVLKGSGTVIAAPGALPAINLSGNGKLATAGSGDVLAGWIGGTWCAMGDGADASQRAFHAAAASVWLHGFAADRRAVQEGARLPLPASGLVAAMRDAVIC